MNGQWNGRPEMEDLAEVKDKHGRMTGGEGMDADTIQDHHTNHPGRFFSTKAWFPSQPTTR